MRRILTTVSAVAALTLAGCTGDWAVRDGANASNPVAAEPSSIAGMKFVGRKIFDDPNLGYYVNYKTPANTTCTLSRYPIAPADIPEGIDSEIIKQHYVELKSVITDFEKKGAYQNLTLLAEDVYTTTADTDRRPYLHAMYAMTFGRQQVFSHLFAAGHGGRHTKIRCTYLRSAAAMEGPKVMRFVDLAEQ